MDRISVVYDDLKYGIWSTIYIHDANIGLVNLPYSHCFNVYCFEIQKFQVTVTIFTNL